MPEQLDDQRREDRDQDQQDHDDAAGHRDLVALEPDPGDLPRRPAGDGARPRDGRQGLRRRLGHVQRRRHGPDISSPRSSRAGSAHNAFDNDPSGKRRSGHSSIGYCEPNLTRRGAPVPVSRPAAAVLVALLAAVLAACAGAPAPTAPPSAAATASAQPSAAFPVTIEHAFGSTTIPAAPQRVVTIGFNEADFALALGVVPVGVRDFIGEYPEEGRPWPGGPRRRHAGGRRRHRAGAGEDRRTAAGRDPRRLLVHRPDHVRAVVGHRADRRPALGDGVGDLAGADPDHGPGARPDRSRRAGRGRHRAAVRRCPRGEPRVRRQDPGGRSARRERDLRAGHRRPAHPAVHRAGLHAARHLGRAEPRTVRRARPRRARRDRPEPRGRRGRPAARRPGRGARRAAGLPRDGTTPSRGGGLRQSAEPAVRAGRRGAGVAVGRRGSRRASDRR